MRLRPALLADRDALQQGYRHAKARAGIDDLQRGLLEFAVPHPRREIGTQQCIAPWPGKLVHVVPQGAIQQRAQAAGHRPPQLPFPVGRVSVARRLHRRVRGHGPRGDVDAWIDELAHDVERLVAPQRRKMSLIGWSLGGIYAREVAKRLQGRVRQVITVGTPFAGKAEHTNVAWIYRLLNGRAPTFDEALMARLRTFNEAQALHALLARLGSPSQLPIPMLIAAGAQLSYLNEQDAALRYLDEAKRADPSYPPTLLARGQVLTYLGRFDDAGADLEACIARAPEIAQAHWFLSRLRKVTPQRNHVDRLRKLLSGQQRRPEDVALLAYAFAIGSTNGRPALFTPAA